MNAGGVSRPEAPLTRVVFATAGIVGMGVSLVVTVGVSLVTTPAPDERRRSTSTD